MLRKNLLLLFIISVFLTACSPQPPRNQHNVCAIFRQYPSWYWYSQAAQRKWGIPVNVLMAILHEESHFRPWARPDHQRLLGWLPWFRPTSAVGYAQAVNDTWRLYLHDTKQLHANPGSFSSAADFIGWYANVAHRQLGISKRNAYQLYLAYHEGLLGYQTRSFRHDPKLMAIARKVARFSNIYGRQLVLCRSHLKQKPWWRFW